VTVQKAHRLNRRWLAGKVYPREIGIQEHSPTIVNLTVKRRYLTEPEVERLMDCARQYGRYGHRDATMILVAYRHGLRASEVCDLQWQQKVFGRNRGGKGDPFGGHVAMRRFSTLRDRRRPASVIASSSGLAGLLRDGH